MSKRRKHKIKLSIGKFYRVLDGSPGGHPGQIYDVDLEEKTFCAVITGSMTYEEFQKLGLRRGYIKLNCPTDDKVDISLVKKRPFIGERNDYGDKEYTDMSFKEIDMEIILCVQKRNPIYGKYYKRRKIKKPR